jgi:hypothetical protein
MVAQQDVKRKMCARNMGNRAGGAALDFMRGAASRTDRGDRILANLAFPRKAECLQLLLDQI